MWWNIPCQTEAKRSCLAERRLMLSCSGNGLCNENILCLHAWSVDENTFFRFPLARFSTLFYSTTMLNDSLDPVPGLIVQQGLKAFYFFLRTEWRTGLQQPWLKGSPISFELLVQRDRLGLWIRFCRLLPALPTSTAPLYYVFSLSFEAAAAGW
jgi:hypothetical protein